MRLPIYAHISFFPSFFFLARCKPPAIFVCSFHFLHEQSCRSTATPSFLQIKAPDQQFPPPTSYAGRIEATTTSSGRIEATATPIKMLVHREADGHDGGARPASVRLGEARPPGPWLRQGCPVLGHRRGLKTGQAGEVAGASPGAAGDRGGRCWVAGMGWSNGARLTEQQAADERGRVSGWMKKRGGAATGTGGSGLIIHLEGSTRQ